jgi:hypothetical protein
LSVAVVVAVAFGLCLWLLSFAFACCLLPCRWLLLLPEL